MTSLPGGDSIARTLSIVRRLILVVLVVALVGTAGELLLVGHVEDFWQWAPLVLITLSLVALVWHAVGGDISGVRVFRTLMYCCMASGLVGVFLHYQGKVEFKLEANPSLAGIELFWAAIKGPAPPVLAPCMMIQIGVLGLAWSYSQASRTTSNVDTSTIPGEQS